MIVSFRTSRDIDAEAVFDAVEIEQVAAVLRDHRVDDQHVGAQIDQPAREIAADEPQTARDQYAPSSVVPAVPIGHGRSLEPWRRGRAAAFDVGAIRCSPRITSACHSFITSMAVR